jgi:hypothetical protein
MTVNVAHEISYKSKEPIDRIVVIKKSWLPYLAFIGPLLQIAFLYYVGLVFVIIFCILFLILILVIQLIVDNGVDEVTLEYTGIRIGNTAIPWESIFEIYIAEDPNSRSRSSYLYIATNDFELKSFNISDYGYRNLGHIIKHYQRVYIDSVPIASK